MTAYAEKLRDPRWQKKRLKVLECARWSCGDCQATDKTLHVHHCRYERNKNPWEYSGSDLMALCEDCHLARAEYEYEAHLALSVILRYCSGDDAHAQLRDFIAPLIELSNSLLFDE